MTKQSTTSKSISATRRDAIAAVSAGVSSLVLRPISAAAMKSATGLSKDEILHTEESIHQIVAFKASPARVYKALTDARQFHQVTLLSAAAKSGMVSIPTPAEISPEAGGAFAVFGGHISGRVIELVTNRRLVQAWRAGDWAPGEYSIARFELFSEGAGTRLVFDHRGFPRGQAEHLAAGWRDNYWAPLGSFLA